jgi:hypothetical protein
MDPADGLLTESRDVWKDFNHRQEFEHLSVDRKTTWGLTTQALLFTAYGVTFAGRSVPDELDHFRGVVAWAGLIIAAFTLLGIAAHINSKRLSWKQYQNFYKNSTTTVHLPAPFEDKKLAWGVNTYNTLLTLIPDIGFPAVFIGAWWWLLA